MSQLGKVLLCVLHGPIPLTSSLLSLCALNVPLPSSRANQRVEVKNNLLEKSTKSLVRAFIPTNHNGDGVFSWAQLNASTKQRQGAE